MSMYVLVDCNSFYCSCERVFRPDLVGRPVVVLSNNDGCIVARSSEAKALGIRMAGPFYKWKKFCRENDVSWFSSNYPLYADMSNRVLQVLRNFSSKVEQYSIDEAFMDLSEIKGDFKSGWWSELAETVRRWTAIPVSVGIGKTKTLAKVANHLAKDRGVAGCQLIDGAEVDEVLRSQQPSDIWGVAFRTQARLNRYGIWSALDLKNADPLMIRKNFSIVLERTVRELNGEACLDFEDITPKRKNIQVSRSFGSLLESHPDMEQAVVAYASRAGEKLRRQKSLACGIYVYLRTNKHKEGPQYNNGAADSFIVPTDNTFEFVTAAKKLLALIFRNGYEYQKVGVMLLDLVERSQHEQKDLFGLTENIKKHDKLMQTLDSINQNFGRGMLRTAAQGMVDTAWRMRSNFHSPHYTTRWSELPVARCG